MSGGLPLPCRPARAAARAAAVLLLALCLAWPLAARGDNEVESGTLKQVLTRSEMDSLLSGQGMNTGICRSVANALDTLTERFIMVLAPFPSLTYSLIGNPSAIGTPSEKYLALPDNIPPWGSAAPVLVDDSSVLGVKSDVAQKKMLGVIFKLFAGLFTAEIIFSTVLGYIQGRDSGILKEVFSKAVVAFLLFLLVAGIPYLVEAFKEGFKKVAELMTAMYDDGSPIYKLYADQIREAQIWRLPGIVVLCYQSIVENMDLTKLGADKVNLLADDGLTTLILVKLLTFLLSIVGFVLTLFAALHVMLNVCECYLLMGVVMVLVPFAVFTPTKFLGGKAAYSLFANVLELFVLMVVIYGTLPLTSGLCALLMSQSSAGVVSADMVVMWPKAAVYETALFKTYKSGGNKIDAAKIGEEMNAILNKAVEQSVLTEDDLKNDGELLDGIEKKDKKYDFKKLATEDGLASYTRLRERLVGRVNEGIALEREERSAGLKAAYGGAPVAAAAPAESSLDKALGCQPGGSDMYNFGIYHFELKKEIANQNVWRVTYEMKKVACSSEGFWWGPEGMNDGVGDFVIGEAQKVVDDAWAYMRIAMAPGTLAKPDPPGWLPETLVRFYESLSDDKVKEMLNADKFPFANLPINDKVDLVKHLVVYWKLQLPHLDSATSFLVQNEKSADGIGETVFGKKSNDNLMLMIFANILATFMLTYFINQSSQITNALLSGNVSSEGFSAAMGRMVTARAGAAVAASAGGLVKGAAGGVRGVAARHAVDRMAEGRSAGVARYVAGPGAMDSAIRAARFASESRGASVERPGQD